MKASEAIRRYRELNQRKAELKAKFDQDIAPIESDMKTIECALLNYMQELDILNIKTEEGTAYISSRESVTCADKEAFMDYVKNTGMWELLEVRPSKSAVVQYKDGRNALPPGINWAAEQVVRVRKSS